MGRAARVPHRHRMGGTFDHNLRMLFGVRASPEGSVRGDGPLDSAGLVVAAFTQYFMIRTGYPARAALRAVARPLQTGILYLCRFCGGYA